MSRLIDADALIAGYKNMGYGPAEHPEESYMEGWCKGFNAAVDHCMHHVIHAQTIEPERKKGKWNGYNTDNPDWLRDDGSPVFLTCSECHGTVMNNGSAHWNFCPNCGARMTEEDV